MRRISGLARGASIIAATVLAVGLPGSAWAHAGHDIAAGFAAGAAHPFGGLDHLLAMLAVGLWAGLAGGRDARLSWLIPLAFLACVAIGGGLAMGGPGGSVAGGWLETGILGSVLLTGGLILAAPRLPVAGSMALAGLFALAHGLAHGAELAAGIDRLAQAAGFLATTALLLGIGVGVARGLAARTGSWVPRAAGGGVILGGLALALAG